jgi:hypothetical protein
LTNGAAFVKLQKVSGGGKKKENDGKSVFN